MGKQQFNKDTWIPASKLDESQIPKDWIPASKIQSVDLNIIQNEANARAAFDKAMYEKMDTIEGLNDAEKKTILDLGKTGKYNSVQMNEFIDTFRGAHPMQNKFIDQDEQGKAVLKDVLTPEQSSKLIGQDSFGLWGPTGEFASQGFANVGKAVGEGHYYLKDGIPVPLAVGQKAPAGYTVDSVWGSDMEAQDDSRVTDISKKIFNIIPSAIQGVLSLPELAQGLTTGKTSTAFKVAQQELESFKFKTSDELNKGVIDTEKVKEFKDIFTTEIYDLSPDKILNTGVNAAASILQLIATRGALGFAGTTGNIATTGNYVAGFTTNLAEPLKAADDAGVTGRSKYAVAALYSTVATAVEMKLGIEGKILNKEASAAKKEMISGLIKNNINIVDGKITEESIEKLMKEAAKKTTSFYKKHGKNVLSEATEEVVQNMTQNGIQEIHDILMKDDPESAKYNTKFWSPKAMAEYMNSAISGAIGGAGGSVVLNNKQSETIYNAIEQGPEKINELKTDITSSLKRGKITGDDFNRAMFKIDAYTNYYEATKDRPINPEDKKKIFDLTYQKENLKSSITTLEENNPGGINDGLIATKKKQVEDMNKEVNDIWLKSEAASNPSMNQSTKDAIKDETVPHWTETVNDIGKASANPANTITQSLKTKEDVDSAIGLSPELNELAKDFKVDFKTSELTEDMPNITVKNGEMTVPFEQEVEGKEGKKEIKIGKMKLPVYAFNDDEGGTWLFAHNENAQEDNGSSYLVKLNDDGSFDSAQEFKFETGKKNELTFDNIPEVFNTLGLQPIGTRKQFSAEEEVDGEGANGDVDAETFEEMSDYDKFQTVYREMPETTATGILRPLGNYKFGVEINGKVLPFASSIRFMNTSNMPSVNDEVTVEKEDNVEGKFGPGLLIKNKSTGEVIGYLRSSNKSMGQKLSAKAAVIVNKIEQDQDNYAKTTDENGRDIYINKKTGEKYGRVSSFISGKEGGDFKGDTNLRDTAYNVGNLINEIVSDFFQGTVKPYSNYYEHIKEEDYNDIVDQLKEVNEFANKKGITIITKPYIIADDVNKIAGTPNLLMIDKQGNVYVYDVATVRNNKKQPFKSLFFTPYKNRGSKADRPAKQVNVYADILKNKFDIDVKGLGVIPFEVGYQTSQGGEGFKIDFVERNARINFKRQQILKYGKQKQSEGSGLQTNIRETEKAKTVKTGTSKERRQIKSPSYLKALEFESTDPYYIALQYFIKKGNINPKSILNLYKGDNTEMRKRISYIKKDAPNLKEIAHKLWEANEELNNDTQDYENALEDVINSFVSRSEMAATINKAQKLEFDEFERSINETIAEVEQEELEQEFGEYTDIFDELSEEEQQRLAEDEDAFNEWFDKIRAEESKNNLDLPSDIVTGEEDQFQKPSGEKQVDVQAVIDILKKANSKLNIIVDDTIKEAGRVNRKGEIRINSKYAGLDTPIHEVGHILIDSIGGTKNLVIKKAIKQLKDTKLWAETKERYPELSEDMLGKEVLAEAIGLEGVGIFETETQKSSFRTMLEYIFDRIKTVLGINRNVAKSLAKQVLSGRVKVPSKVEESLQKNKKPRKITREEYFRNFYKSTGISLDTLETQIEQLKLKLKQKLSPEDKKKFKDKLDSAEKKLENFEKAYKKFSYDYNKMNNLIKSTGGLEGKSIEELTEIYNIIAEYDLVASNEYFDELKYRIAHLLAEQQIELLEKKGVNTRAAKFQDLSSKDVLMKALGHMSEAFPEVQQLSKQYDKQVSEMNTERSDKLDKLNSLAKAVVKEEATNLGLKAKDFTIGNAHKFFKWMDAGDGKFITTSQAKALSPAKGAYMEYVRQLQEEYKEIQEKTAAGYEEDAALKVDKGFIESFESSGIVAAIQKWAGSSEMLRSVKMKFTDAKGNTELKTLGEIEKTLQAEAKSGLISKAVAVSKSVYYNLKAKKLASKGMDEAGDPVANSNYTVDRKGKLVNKFGNKRKEDFDYSKNFHAAAVQYVNDMTWTKHMQPLIPIVESIEHFNNVTGIDRNQKANLIKWMKNWKAMHLYQENKTSPFPALDLVMKNLRGLTSMAALAFNVPAAKMNLVIGEYNNWREIGAKDLAKGHKRLASTTKGGGKKISTKATNILKKYNVVATDYDERPDVSAGKLFNNLANGMTKLAEFTIQGSLFLGQMTTEQWNSFDKDGNYTGSDPDIVKKMESYKKKVSNVHGKYSAKDRRNFELYEFGKFVGQFKTWVPDWWKERFGSRYFDENGDEHYGNWRAFQYQALKDLRRDITTKEFWTSNDIKHKSMRTNLKSAMVFATLLAIRLSGDDDREKKKAGDFLSQAIGNLTFVFDPQQASFVLKNPVAGMGTALKFVDALNSAIKAERYKGNAKWGDKGDLKAPGKFAQILPYNKIVFNELTMDEK